MNFRKDEGHLEEKIGGTIVCDKVCLGVGSTSTLFSCDKSQSSLLKKLPEKLSMTIELFLEELKLLPAFAAFQVPTAQNNLDQ